MITPEEIRSRIAAALPQAPVKVVCDSLLIENPETLLQIASFLRNAEDLRFDYLASVTAVDYPKFLETVYHLYSMEKKWGPVVLRVRINRSEAKIPSLCSVYRGAEFQEREAYDLFGILYENHPDPRRILMWEGFEGTPLRKDYEREDSATLEMRDVEWLERHGIKVPSSMRKQAEALQKEGRRSLARRPGKEGA